MQLETLNTILKQNNYSLTNPRKQVFTALLGEKPQSMQQLVNSVGSKADRASIYRSIELYEKLGIVHRLNIGWKHKFELSDAFIGHHHHFYCTNCGKTYSLEANTMLETMIESVASKAGFSPRGHQLEIYGFCKNCAL